MGTRYQLGWVGVALASGVACAATRGVPQTSDGVPRITVVVPSGHPPLGRGDLAARRAPLPALSVSSASLAQAESSTRRPTSLTPDLVPVYDARTGKLVGYTPGSPPLALMVELNGQDGFTADQRVFPSLLALRTYAAEILRGQRGRECGVVYPSNASVREHKRLRAAGEMLSRLGCSEVPMHPGNFADKINGVP